MADKFTREERSRLMSRVRSKRTTPEIKITKLLKSLKIRYTTSIGSKLPGSPDILLRDSRTAIFVHGCFWHGHYACSKGTTLPVSNQSFWLNKITKNRLRDNKVIRELKSLGYNVIVIWECQIKSTERLSRKLLRVK